MFAIFSKLLANRRAIGMGLVVLALVGGGWYFSGLISENQILEDKLSRFQSANQEMSRTIQRQEQKHEAELEAVNSSMEAYMHSLSMARKTNSVLEIELQRVSKNDEELQRCLDMPLPDSTVERLRQ